MNLIAYLSDERGRGKRLASLLGVTPTTIHEWAHKKKQVPAERCAAIERATGGTVTCEELRPDLAEHWAYLASRGAAPRPPQEAA